VADIDIVPKRKSSTWLWILLAIIVAIALMWVLTKRDTAPRSGSIPQPGHWLVAAMPTSGVG